MAPEQLRAVRAEKGWTQRQLADRLGVSIVTVRAWERGRRRMPRMAERYLALILTPPTHKP